MKLMSDKNKFKGNKSQKVVGKNSKLVLLVI